MSKETDTKDDARDPFTEQWRDQGFRDPARRSNRPGPAALEADYRAWLTTMFPAHFRGLDEFAPHHDEYWRHVWEVTLKKRPAPFLAIWNRKGMKSTCAEATGPVLAALGKRCFGLYVSSTQDKADAHLETIKDMLVASPLGDHYPRLARPEIKRVATRTIPGSWNHAELETAAGLAMTAVGLNKSVRGLRRGSQRPDFIILDDIEDENDSMLVIQAKIERLKSGILPAGAQNCAVFFVQNLIHRDSVISQVLDGRAEILLGHKKSGPVPAVRNQQIGASGAGPARRFRLSGSPTWVGFDLAACEAELNLVGLSAWQREYQHKVETPYLGAVYPAFDERYHVITYSEFMRVYAPPGANAVRGSRLSTQHSALSTSRPSTQHSALGTFPHRGYYNFSIDAGTTLGHPGVGLWNWRPAEGMPNSDCLFFIGEICRPRFPPGKEIEIVSPLRLGKEIQDKERAWGITVQWRQGSHEAALLRNSFGQDLGEIAGYEYMHVDPIRTEDGAKGIAAIQDLLERDDSRPHPFRVYPLGHPKAGEPLVGRPVLYLVVADGQGELYFDLETGELKVRPALDEDGLSRTRYEFPKYRYPTRGQGAEAAKPVKMEDDAMDAMKAAVARCKPFMEMLTGGERHRLEYQQGMTRAASEPDPVSQATAAASELYWLKRKEREEKPADWAWGHEFFGDQDEGELDQLERLAESEEKVPDWWEGL